VDALELFKSMLVIVLLPLVAGIAVNLESAVGVRMRSASGVM
jgi:hypothetical protein